MTDLEALAALVRTLREAGVTTYEGPAPGGHVKLTLRPPDPAPKVEPERPTQEREEKAERKPIPAGLFGVV